MLPATDVWSRSGESRSAIKRLRKENGSKPPRPVRLRVLPKPAPVTVKGSSAALTMSVLTSKAAGRSMIEAAEGLGASWAESVDAPRSRAPRRGGVGYFIREVGRGGSRDGKKGSAA